MRQSNPVGRAICALLMAANAGAWLQLSNKNLFGDQLQLLSCEQNLEISRFLSIRLPAEASAYAREAQLDSMRLGSPYKTLAFRESASAQLACHHSTTAKQEADSAIQFCGLWLRDGGPKEEKLVTMQMAECERVAALAYWSNGDKQAAVETLDRATNRCLRILDSLNRDSVCVKLAELSKTKSKMLRKARLPDADKQEAVAAMLANVPACASVSAIRKAVIAPPPVDLWEKLRTSRSIEQMVSEGQLPLVEQYLEQLRRFDDESGHCINYDFALVSTADSCAKQGKYHDAGRISQMLAERFWSHGDCVAGAACRQKAAAYYLAGNDFRNTHLQFKKVVECLAQKPNAGLRWNEVCHRTLSLAFEMVAREKLSGLALVETLSPLAEILQHYRQDDQRIAVYNSLLQTALQQALLNGEIRDASKLQSLLPHQDLANTLVSVANQFARSNKLQSAIHALEQCQNVCRSTGAYPSQQLVDTVEDVATKLMEKNKYQDANEILQKLDAVQEHPNLYRAIRECICLYALKGQVAGTDAQARALETATNTKERSLARQLFLDLLHEHLARQKKTADMKALCLQHAKNLDQLRVFWGHDSEPYAAALIQCSSLHEQLGDFESATKYLHECAPVFKGGRYPLLFKVFRAHQQNCAANLLIKAPSRAASAP